MDEKGEAKQNFAAHKPKIKQQQRQKANPILKISSSSLRTILILLIFN